MLISLYTSRVILNALGVEDYGIYNVVGGVVTMFSMLSGTLSAAISRFITFELGTGNKEKLIRVFSSSVTIQIGIATLIIILAESIGLWFLNYKMVIPHDRLIAANWCYQFSIITFAINLVSVPYNAAIIAHEKMSAFAYISIVEAVGRLTIAWLIVINPFDRLVFYACMVAILSIMIRLIYGWYCKRNFKECTYRFIYDNELLKRMFSFAGWNFIGASSAVLRNSGTDIILNLFFGPTVNAARGIAVKVDSVITHFVTNFMMALNPQITKSYANGNKKYMFKLIFQGARYSYYILLLLGLPVLLNTQYILEIWLKNVPDHTVLFVQLILVLGLSECISNPLVTAMLATGIIRNYQIVVGGLQMMNLPIAYLCLYLGAVPESVIVVAIVLSQCCLVARLYMLRGMIGLSIRQYLEKVYFNVIRVTLIAAILPFIVVRFFETDIINLIFITLFAIFCVLLSELFIGCNRTERGFVYQKATNMARKYFKK